MAKPLVGSIRSRSKERQLRGVYGLSRGGRGSWSSLSFFWGVGVKMVGVDTGWRGGMGLYGNKKGTLF